MGRRILGIDPGLASSGWGLIEQRDNRVCHLAHGCIETAAADGHAPRLLAIYRAVKSIIGQWRPDAGALETLYFAKNVKTALPVSEARGVLCLALAEAALPVFEYSPNLIKQAVVGVGSADKRQVQEMTRLILGLADIPRPDHAADALGAAICCAYQIPALSPRP